jgi:hypothetical protein
MLICLPTYPDDESLESLRTDFMLEMRLDWDDFRAGGPFMVVDEKERKYMPSSDKGCTWVDVNIWRNYFGEGYSRGAGEFFIKCGRWLDARLPGCKTYYGHDVDDENLTLFDEPARERLHRLIRLTRSDSQ